MADKEMTFKMSEEGKRVKYTVSSYGSYRAEN